MSGMMMGAAAWQLSGIPWTFDFNSKLTALPTALRRMNATYTRNSVKNVVQDGVLVQLAANQFGTSYDDVTGLYGYVPEPAATNLCLYSEDQANAAWIKTNATISANAVAAPDGTTTADLITRSSTAAAQSAQVFVKAASAITYTFAFFVKKSVGDYVALRINGSVIGNRADVVFNINTGVISTAASVTGTFTEPAALIVAIGSYYKISLTATSNTDVALTAAISFSSNGVVVDGTDSAANSAGYAWGAQIETGARATSYIPTVAATATRAASVLSVPLWVNNCTYSQDGSNAVWATGENIARSVSGTAPDGTATAILCTATATAATSMLQTGCIKSPSTTVTASFYIKQGNRAVADILLRNVTTATAFSYGVLTFATGVISGAGWSAENVGNGWFRVKYTQSTGISVGDALSMYYGAVGGTWTAGDTQYVWGMQLEAGSIATAYRPTTSTLESVANANIPGFSSAGYTLFADVRADVVTSASQYALSISDGASNNVADIAYANTIDAMEVTSGGVPQVDDYSGTPSTSRVKYAMSCAVNNFRMAKSGTARAADTSGVMPTGLTILRIGASPTSTLQFNGRIRRAGIITRALTQAQINELTV